MLALQPTTTSTKKLTPNILPCRITHSGPITTSKRYWNPSKITKGTQTSYLRGRKLLGRSIKLPDNYTGLVLQKTDKVLPRPAREQDGEDEEDEDGEDDEPVEVKTMETVGTFDAVVVWGHEMVPQEGEDVYMKGLREWIGFAETMHSCEDKDGTKS